MTMNDAKANPDEEAPEVVDSESAVDANERDNAAHEVPAEEAAEESVPESEGPDGAKAEVEEVDEATKWKEVALRTAADLENYRKRASREREESIRYANQSILEELLPILDNFEMGMQAAEQEKDSMVYVGMNMVRQQFCDFMAAQGVEEVDCLGREFDPNVHEAVSEEESSECEPGHILRVTRRGFVLRDRLLRPASVVVAKKPQGAGEEEPEA